MKTRFQRLPSAHKDLILEMGHLADQQNVPLYLVGGPVRDMILGGGHLDLDFVVEGDGVAFAESMAEKRHAKIIVHRRFGTATVWIPDSHKADRVDKVDVASARREVYEKPGALPIVAPGTIHDDLFRRDFTVNAMAMSVNAARFGELVDDFGGRDDLEAGIVRVLHSLSFWDDPTRILRAVRFEQRFGFTLEKTTLAVLREAVRAGMLHNVQKHRLRDELILIFKEADPFRALDRLGQLAGFSFIAPGLKRQLSWRREFAEIRKALDSFRMFHPKKNLEVYRAALALFFARLSLREAETAMRDFAFHRTESACVFDLIRTLPGMKKELHQHSVRPSAVYHLLGPLSLEIVFLLPVLLKSGASKRHIQYFLEWSRFQRLHIKGEDLKALGLKPGPRYKEILRGLLSAKIDKEVVSPENEIAWVKRSVMKG